VTGLLVVALALLGTIVRADDASPPTVTWANGRVTAQFENVPVDEVVAALEQAAGVEFHGGVQNQRQIQARFERVPFQEVVARLLGEQNFTITYDAAGLPRRVDLLGMPQQPRPGKASPTGFGKLVYRYGPVSLPPVLATALGVPRSDLPSVLRQGLRHRDPAVGAAAVSLFVRTVEADPALLGALLRADDSRVTRLLQIWSGLGFERLVTGLAAEADDPMLRSKARRLQQRFRDGRAQRAPTS
jgi:hypothetical protein